VLYDADHWKENGKGDALHILIIISAHPKPITGYYDGKPGLGKPFL